MMQPASLGNACGSDREKHSSISLSFKYERKTLFCRTEKLLH